MVIISVISVLPTLGLMHSSIIQVHRELDKCQVKDSVIGISIRPSINMPSVLLGYAL